jgi:hypothetical protein
VADRSIADQLRDLGVKDRDVLVKMAERGQLLEVKCEMPECYHDKGRGKFDQLTTTRSMWAPSRDHYPILASADGKLVPQNVRLSHTECNQRDYTRRKQIGGMLEEGKSLADIADFLNRRGYPPPLRTDQWTAALVRKAYVS